MTVEPIPGYLYVDSQVGRILVPILRTVTVDQYMNEVLVGVIVFRNSGSKKSCARLLPLRTEYTIPSAAPY